MKKIKAVLVILLVTLVSFAWAETIKLGNHIFFSDDGGINIAVHAGVAVRNMDEPYVMFMLYMGADKDVSATISTDDITMIYEGREYPMTSLEELRENYTGDSRDEILLSSLIQNPLENSQLRYYRFPPFRDFFPSRNSGTIPISEASMNQTVGFRTRVYFKNPGFKKGDKIGIQIRDKDNPDIWGGVAAILED